MAAPFYAYTNRELSVQDSTGTKKHYVAKLDTSYNTMKSRFYLDDFVNVDGVGVIGCVTIGGANASRHNLTTRGGVGRNGDMILLNDAGLNTRGRAFIETSQVDFEAGFVVTIRSVSAYYVDGDSVTASWKRTSESSWVDNVRVINQTQDTDIFYGVALLSGSNPLKPKENINLKVKHTNIEGTTESTTTTLQVPMPSGTFGYSGLYGSDAYSNFQNNISTATYFFDDFIIQGGTKVFFNAAGTISVAAGYIANGTSWYKIEVIGGESIVTGIGMVGSWDAGDPATPSRFIESTFPGWSTDWSYGCTYPGLWTPITIWYDNQDNVYRWSNNSGGTLVGGNFFTGNIHPNYGYEFVHIANGVMLPETFDCTHGLIISP